MSQRPQPTALENIETVARLEQQFLEERTWIDRVGDAVGTFVGTMSFVLMHAVLFLVWIAINLRLVPGVPAFDPFPFMLLAMAVSLEGVLLTTFVLMKQNRMSKRADQRDQLNLQIDLLSEREVTRILQMLIQVCERLGVEPAAEPETRQLSEITAVDQLAQELKKKLPE